MPQPTLPPTPAASLDITGKSAYINGPTISLGPAAVHESSVERSPSATPSAIDSESSYDPSGPSATNNNKRKQPSKSTKTIDSFGLPPPPSRSRKIIQVKPKTEDAAQTASHLSEEGGASAGATPAKGSRKKGASTTSTAAGRKMARKTAHSLIERRRRSKMNEEFGVLKDMIPACRGHEMHKLAILQASIDYLRYLEQCITDLKAGEPHNEDAESDLSTMELDNDEPDTVMSDTSPAAASQTASVMRPSTSSSSHTPSTSQASPINLPPLSYINTNSTHPSPLFRPQDSSLRPRQPSIASTTAHFSPYMVPQPGSTSTSPLFRPMPDGSSSSNNRRSVSSLAGVAGEAIQRFSLTSPALLPVDSTGMSGASAARSDREAMAALLMLNSSERRGSVVGVAGASATENVQGARKVPRKAGAMSVRDLLSPE